LAKKKKTPGTPGILISRKGLLIWISLVIFIACWMFVLGIIVGRGIAPVNLEVGKLEQELADLKAKMFRQEKAALDAQASGRGSESPELGFYEALKSSKKTEPFKSLPQASIKPIEAAKPIKKVPEPKPVPKPKPVAKPKSVKPPQPAARKVAEKGRFTIQVAASKDAKSAEKLVNTLRSKGFKAYQIRNEVAGKGIWYRVRVGAYQDQGAAGKVLSKLKAGHYRGMIVRTK
jgi:cell division protein FtsN